MVDNRGQCYLCSREFSRRGMTRHLSSCREKRSTQQSEETTLYHIFIDDAYSDLYWLHVEMPETATLRNLDSFLREIWVECCNHLSGFEIDQVRYVYPVEVEDFFGLNYQEQSMEVPVGQVLKAKDEFQYIYDYGTSTILKLRVVACDYGPVPEEPVHLLARNKAPQIPCFECDAQAEYVCQNCIWEGCGWLCAECAHQHPCGEDMLLPVVNSPRVGMCAYGM